MKKILAPLLALLCMATVVVAHDKTPTHPDGQVFTMVKDATLYKYPFVTSEIIDTLPAGTQVTIVAYDPDNHWARIRMAPVDGVWTDRFIDLKSVDFPGGEELKIEATFTGGDHKDDGSPKYRAKRYGNEKEMRYYYLLMCLIGLSPVAYKLFRSRFEGRERAFVGATLGFTVVWLAYTYGYKAMGVTLDDSTNFWFMFFKMTVMVFVVYCAVPLLRWSWDNIGGASIRRRPIDVILSLLFMVTIVYIALQAVGLFLMVGIVAVAFIGLFVSDRQSQSEMEMEFRNAVLSGRLGKAEKLLARGVKIDSQDHKGMTALMHACDRGIINITEWLLDKGAYTEVRDKDGNTAIMYAAMWCYDDIIAILSEHGADINVQNNDGQGVWFVWGKNLEE